MKFIKKDNSCDEPLCCRAMKGSPSAALKLLPCDHEVMGSSPGNCLLQKCRERSCT
jgi:hypothetical protein